MSSNNIAHKEYIITFSDYKSIELIVDVIAKDYENEIRQDFINRFYDLFRILDTKQRLLIRFLSKKICNVRLNDYIKYIYRIVNSNFDLDMINGYNSIFAIPIGSSSDKDRIKSGHLVAYLLPEVMGRIFGNGINKRVSVLQNFEYLSSHPNRNNSLIIFCDSFIGTGTQAIGCLKEYEKNKKIDDTVIILSLVILESGLDLLNNNNYKVIYESKFSRAISDNNILMNCNADKIMDGIEKLIQVPERYCFGYGRSEALLTFDFKAPNNTFPIYWYKGRSTRQPIFER